MAKNAIEEAIDSGDRKKALKLELKRQMRAISASGGRMFPNVMSIYRIIQETKPGMNEGGLVRGGGVATKGRGRGKIV